jgi:hypothetical protein
MKHFLIKDIWIIRPYWTVHSNIYLKVLTSGIVKKSISSWTVFFFFLSFQCCCSSLPPLFSSTFKMLKWIWVKRDRNSILKIQTGSPFLFCLFYRNFHPAWRIRINWLMEPTHVVQCLRKDKVSIKQHSPKDCKNNNQIWNGDQLLSLIH